MKIDGKGLKTFRIHLNFFSMSEFLISLFEKSYQKRDRGGKLLPPLSPGGVKISNLHIRVGRVEHMYQVSTITTSFNAN